MKASLQLACLVLAVLLLAHAPDLTADQTAWQGALRDLNSESAGVRRQAANRLGRLGDRRATSALIQTLADPEPGVRREAARALGLIKDVRATQALVGALRDTDQNVRFYSAYALGEIKSPETSGALLKMLHDPAWPVRDQAAWALGEIGGSEMAGPLVDMLVQDRGELSQLVWLLRQLDRETTLAALSQALDAESDGARERTLIALAALQDTQARPLLVRALGDASPRVRWRAVRVLAALGDRLVLEQLRELARQDPDSKVRQAASEAVESLSRDNDLLAYWSFDDVKQPVVRDLTDNGNDGQVIGCPTVPGKMGNALQFGPGQYVELGRPPQIPVGNVPFTVTAWVKTGASDGVVVARGGAYCGFSLYVKDDIPKFGIHRDQEGPGYIVAGQAFPRDQWVHLAGVVKRDRIELYVDGRLAGSTETAGYLPGNCGQGMEIGFDVGNSPAEIVTPWNGLIDEVKVYGVALSEDELRAECAK